MTAATANTGFPGSLSLSYTILVNRSTPGLSIEFSSPLKLAQLLQRLLDYLRPPALANLHSFFSLPDPLGPPDCCSCPEFPSLWARNPPSQELHSLTGTPSSPDRTLSLNNSNCPKSCSDLVYNDYVHLDTQTAEFQENMGTELKALYHPSGPSSSWP